MGYQLAVLAAVSFAILDVLRKLLGRRLSPSQIVIGLNSGAALVFAVFLAGEGIPVFDHIFVLIALAEIVTFTWSSILYVQAVSISPLSLTVPYLALTPVVSGLVATVVLGELPDWRGASGIAVTVAGALLLQLEPRAGLRRLAQAPFREPGSWRMILVALIWGITTSLDKVAIAHGSEALLGLFLSAGGAVFLIGLRRVYPRVDGPTGGPSVNHAGSVPAREPLLYLASGVAAMAVLSQFLAYRELMVAYVETVKRAGGLLSALAGVVFFGEERSVFRLPAAALMIAGVILLAW